MNSLDMNTKQEKSQTVAAGPVYVFMSSNKGTSSGSVASDGLQEEIMNSLPHPQGVVGERPITDRINDRYVASDPQPVDWFTVALRDAVAFGYISPTGADRVLSALYSEVTR